MACCLTCRYASKFFANPEAVEYIEYPKGQDPLLRFYDSCAKYQRDVKQNKSAIQQERDFERSQFMAKNTETLKLALGLQNTSAEMTATDVEAAFSACAFDYALYGTTTEWCSLLTEAFIVTVDYLDDLKAFYELGGGYRINYEMSAVLLQDIFASMKGRIDETNNLHNILNFAHAETTLPLMTLLGYTDRTALYANASLAAIEGREFRTSVSAPFGANIEFRLFQRKSNEDQYFVQVLVNEHEDEIPGCGDVYCDLAKVERLWRFYLEEYDFETQCKVES